MGILSNNYLLTCLRHMNWDVMLEKAGDISKRVKRPAFVIMGDMIWCAARYGAGYMDYYLFEMFNMNGKQRDTIVTRKRNNSLVRKYNDPKYMPLLDNKDEFNRLFGEYLKRRWIAVAKDNREEVFKFMEETQLFMAKPTNACCGKGIRKIDLQKDDTTPQDVYRSLIEDEYDYILEEVICQHEDVNRLYAGSINTARVVTIRKDNVTHFICAFLRVGNGRIVDNFNNGGMMAPIDVETGIIHQNAVDKNKIVYTEHPLTGTTFKGFQLPDWEKAKEMCHKASAVVPQVGYVGWDVCFTPQGPCLVEANEYPGYDVYQLPEHIPDKVGLWPKFQV